MRSCRCGWPYPISAGSGSQKNSRREILVRRRGIDEHYAASHARIVDRKITWHFCLHVTPEDKTALKIDIDKLSEEELIDLNHRIVERLRFLNQMRAHSQMLDFKIGDRVTFQPEGRQPLVGMLTRYNKKTVTVITENGQHWNVAPGLLRKVEPADRTHAGDAKVVRLRKE